MENTLTTFAEEKNKLHEINNNIKVIELLLRDENLDQQTKDIIQNWIQDIKNIEQKLHEGGFFDENAEADMKTIQQAYLEIFLAGASVSQAIGKNTSANVVGYPLNKQNGELAKILLHQYPELKNITLHKEVTDITAKIAEFDKNTATYIQKLHKQLREDSQKRAHNPLHALLPTGGKIFDELINAKNLDTNGVQENLINQGWKNLYANYLIYTLLNNPEVKKIHQKTAKEKQEEMTQNHQKKVQNITNNHFFQLYSEQGDNEDEIQFYSEAKAFQQAFEDLVEIYVLMQDLQEDKKESLISFQNNLHLLVNTVKIYFEKYADINTKDVLKNAGLKNKQQQDKARKLLQNFIDKNSKCHHSATQELAQFLKYIIKN